jgi:hypothetical protein
MISKFNTSLEGDHARRTVAAQADAQQSRWRRYGALKRTEACRNRDSWHTGFHIARQGKVRMVIRIEELNIETKRDAFFNWKAVSAGAKLDRMTPREGRDTAE